jgi:hypothetical protein
MRRTGPGTDTPTASAQEREGDLRKLRLDPRCVEVNDTQPLRLDNYSKRLENLMLNLYRSSPSPAASSPRNQQKKRSSQADEE